MSEDPSPTTISTGEPLDASSRPAGASAPTNVPDLMKIGAVPVNTLMDVETDVLEPVVQSDTFCRFRLQNKGILHSNSKLTFALTAGLSGGNDCQFPYNIGIHSLIKRCVLKSGTKTLCETDGFNQFMGYRSLFINPQHNKQREAFTTSRFMCRKWLYNNGPNQQSDAGAGLGVSDTNAVGYTIDTGREHSSSQINRPNRNTHLPYVLQVARGAVELAPVFQIALNDLFPFLKMNQLPLYMCKEELDIELHYEANNKRLCVSTADTTAATVILTDTKMIADYIYYPQEMMDAYANANRKLGFTYVDYRRVRHTITTVAGAAPPVNAANTIILNLGGAGRIVNKVFFCVTENKTNPERLLLNDFTADGLENEFTALAPQRTFGTFTHNIKYNDNMLYPVDISNPSRVVDNITQAEGSPPFISKDEWSRQEGLVTHQLVSNKQLMASFNSKFCWTCDRLNRNERINSRGIELYATWDTLASAAAPATFTFNGWLELVRYAVLEDGQFTVTWA